MNLSSENTNDQGEYSASTRYRVLHRTAYSYSTPVAMCQNQLKMTPRSRMGVELHASEVRISPCPDSSRIHTDYFGNEVTTFAIEALHDELVVEVESDLTILGSRNAQPESDPSWEELVADLKTPVRAGMLEVGEFTYPSPRIDWNDEIRSYALASFSTEASLAKAALDLTQRIFRDFKYDTTATHVGTSVREAFQLKAGVCQDFAQLQIACLRSLGLAASYVSGYLRTMPPPGKTKLIGADESHAWCSIYTGKQGGWLDLDPTNGCIVGQDHIPICFGRDYLDVSPMCGVAVGGGDPRLSISVDVSENPSLY
ncbi:MAG: transglutaminase family protein [Planctomycetota bacterium]